MQLLHTETVQYTEQYMEQHLQEHPQAIEGVGGVFGTHYCHGHLWASHPDVRGTYTHTLVKKKQHDSFLSQTLLELELAIRQHKFQ